MQGMDALWMIFGLVSGLLLVGAFYSGFRLGISRESEDAARMRDEVGDFMEQGRLVMERLRGRDRRRARRQLPQHRRADA